MPSSVQQLNRKRQELEQAKKQKDDALKNMKSRMADEEGNAGDTYLALLGRTFEEARDLAEQIKQIKKEIFSIL